MFNIKRLSFKVISQISAGEIIENPTAVLKELIENSLDAKSTVIKINLYNSGLKMISINDNGIGIKKNELYLSLMHHTTSKIRKIEDLSSIASFGFRGEALASISSVSRLILTSKTSSQKNAWQIYSEEGKTPQFIKPVAHPIGTTIEISDLFFNIPVRKKFMRNSNTELIHIKELIKKFLLSHSNIKIILVNNGRRINNYNYSKNNFFNIINNKIHYKNVICIQSKEKNNIYGFIEDPKNYETMNLQQYIFVNKRIINNKIIKHAICQAYYDNKKIIDNYYQPSYLVCLNINCNEININCHPQKHEIKFNNARNIHDFIYQIFFNTLKNKNSKNKKIIDKIQCINTIAKVQKNDFIQKNNNTFGNLLIILHNRYAIVEKQNNIFIISIFFAKKILLEQQFILEHMDNICVKKLFFPITIKVSKCELNFINLNYKILSSIGIKLKFSDINSQIKIQQLPKLIYEIKNLKFIILNIVKYISNKKIKKKNL